MFLSLLSAWYVCSERCHVLDERTLCSLRQDKWIWERTEFFEVQNSAKKLLSLRILLVRLANVVWNYKVWMFNSYTVELKLERSEPTAHNTAQVILTARGRHNLALLLLKIIHQSITRFWRRSFLLRTALLAIRFLSDAETGHQFFKFFSTHNTTGRFFMSSRKRLA